MAQEIQLWELSQPERQALLDYATKQGTAHLRVLFDQLLRQAGNDREELDRRLREKL